MQTIVIVIHLMVVTTMIGLVLLQRSEGGGLGMGGGGFMTNRGTANVLTRATAALAGVFFVTSLLLSLLAGWDRKPRSILQGDAPASQGVPAPSGQPGSGGGGGGGVLDTLRQQSQQPPPGPAGPQAPRSQ